MPTFVALSKTFCDSTTRSMPASAVLKIIGVIQGEATRASISPGPAKMKSIRMVVLAVSMSRVIRLVRTDSDSTNCDREYVGNLSDVDVCVSVLAGFEGVMDLLVVSTKLRHLARDFPRVLSSDHYSRHEIRYLHHLRFFHSQPCHF